jgi:hypothetical protein
MKRHPPPILLKDKAEDRRLLGHFSLIPSAYPPEQLRTWNLKKNLTPLLFYRTLQKIIN